MPGLPSGHLGGGAGVGAALHVPGPTLVAPVQVVFVQHWPSPEPVVVPKGHDPPFPIQAA